MVKTDSFEDTKKVHLKLKFRKQTLIEFYETRAAIYSVDSGKHYSYYFLPYAKNTLQTPAIHVTFGPITHFCFEIA